MKVILRSYALSDRTGLIRAINAVCGEGLWMSTSRFEPTPAWEHALADPNCGCHLLLLAVGTNAPVGWCRVFREPDVQGTVASLGIGLLPIYRDRGIGTQMAQKALAWAWSADVERVVLRTRRDNHRAVRVFSRCGFYVTDEAGEGWVEMACDPPALRAGRSNASIGLERVLRLPVVSVADRERTWL